MVIVSWVLTVIQYEQSDVFGRYLIGTTAYDMRSYLAEINVYIEHIRAFNLKEVIFSSYGASVTLFYSLPLIMNMPFFFAIINSIAILITFRLIISLDIYKKFFIATIILNPYYLISIWGPSKDILALLFTVITFYVIRKDELNLSSSKQKLLRFIVILLILLVTSSGIRANIALSIFGFIFFYIIRYVLKFHKYSVYSTLIFISSIVYVVYSSGLKDSTFLYESSGSSYIPDWISNANPFVKLILLPVYLILYALWDYVKPLPVANKQIDLVYLSLTIGGIFIAYSVLLMFLKWKNFIINYNNASVYTLIYILITIQNNYIHPRYLYPVIPCIFLLTNLRTHTFLFGLLLIIFIKIFISFAIPLTGQMNLDASLPPYLPYDIFFYN